jgi:hypothetical protein
LALVAGLALCLRLGWAAYAQPEPVSDFLQYRQLAAGIWEHGQFGHPEPTAFRLPGYPIFLAGLMAISDSRPWLILANVLLSTLSCHLLARLAGRLFPARPGVALSAGLIAALYPSFILYSSLLASENLFLPLMLGALLAALSAWPWPRAVAACGLLLAAAAYVRGEALLLCPVFFFIFLLDRRETPGSGSLARRGAAAACLALLVAAALAPWVWRNHSVMGPGVLLTTNSGVALYEGNNPHGYSYQQYDEIPLAMNEVKRNRKARRLALDYILSNPERLPASVARKTWRLYRPTRMASRWAAGWGGPGPKPHKPPAGLAAAAYAEVGGYLALVLMAALFPLLWRETPRRTIWVLGSLLAINWLMYGVVFVGIMRYRFLPEAIFCLLAGAVCHRLVQLAGRASREGGP